MTVDEHLRTAVANVLPKLSDLAVELSTDPKPGEIVKSRLELADDVREIATVLIAGREVDGG